MNNINITRQKKDFKKNFRAILYFVIIGFLTWMTSIFIGTLRNNINLNNVIELSLIFFGIYSYVYICKIMYMHFIQFNVSREDSLHHWCSDHYYFDESASFSNIPIRSDM